MFEKPAILCVLTILAAAGPMTGPATAEVILAGWVQSQSPDSRRVELNGVFMPGSAESGWWYCDWGDATRGTHYFPMCHRYQEPGEYTIRLVGFNDLGEHAEVSTTHTVSLAPVTDVTQVILAKTFLGMHEADQRTVMFSAYDEAGEPLSLDGRTVELYAPITGVIDVVINNAQLDLTALSLGGADTKAAWVCVYVDGVECERPLFVVVNANTGSFTTVGGLHSGFYLPDWFFDQAYVSEPDHALILDLAYEEFSWSVSLDNELEGYPPVQGVSYIPPVHGANGNPLALGDSAGPIDGAPRFDIIFHETGHNFDSWRNMFPCLGGPAVALYQETSAEWHVQFGCNRLLDLHSGELSVPAEAALTYIRDANRDYHAYEYQNYIDGGMVFDFGSIMPSHVLVQKIYELCDVYGWERMRDFYDYFDIPKMAAVSSLFGDFGGSTNVYRLSALVAVLGLTFEQDLRPTFVALNFPIDDTMHDAVWAVMEADPAPVDFDNDGDVDATDLDRFEECSTGPSIPYDPTDLPPGCTLTPDGEDVIPADLDRDGDVDHSDFGLFQRCYSGANEPADPDCAD